MAACHATMLDHSRAHIARRADRCKADEQGVVALLPRNLTDLTQPVLVLVLGDHSYLRGARLATHSEAGIGNALGISRAALLVYDGIHPVENQREHLRADAELGKIGWHPDAARR